MVLCAVLPVKTKTPLVMRIGLHDEGLVLLTPEIPGEPSEAVRQERGGNGFKRISGFAHSGDSFRRGQTQTANQQSVCGLERRKRTQRIRGLAHGAGTRSVEAVSDVPPAAPSFPSCRKRWGRKGALGYVWCFLPLNSGRNLCFRRRSTRWSPYGRLGTRRLIRESQICN